MTTATLATLSPALDVDYAERARRLGPVIEAGVAEAEVTNQIAPSVMSALREAGLLRLLLPRALGGGALDPDQFVPVIEAIAAADASTAWTVNQTSVCSAGAAFMTPFAAKEIYGPANGMLAWGAGAKARAQECANESGERGYRVTGTWQFASGSRHATHIGGHCGVVDAAGAPRLGPNGKQIERTMLFPRHQVKFDDVWRVMGLKGTGSDTYTVTDLFVAEPMSCPTITDWIVTTPADPAPLYRFSGSALYAAGFGAIALGNARGMLDTFIHIARDKTPRGAKNALRDSAVVQMQVALADTQLRAARTFLIQSLREVQDGIRATGAITTDDRMTIRAAGTNAIHRGTEVVETLYRAAGATAIFETEPFERRFRDAYSVSQHLQGRLAHFEQIGKHLLGQETDLMFV
ncbi:MAG: Acyl-CoA dehydrogenase [Reyranella sp.]|nr:Acyl-CoA dehydrogenase [Reyranella sp.]